MFAYEPNRPLSLKQTRMSNKANKVVNERFTHNEPQVSQQTYFNPLANNIQRREMGTQNNAVIQRISFRLLEDESGGKLYNATNDAFFKKENKTCFETFGDYDELSEECKTTTISQNEDIIFTGHGPGEEGNVRYGVQNITAEQLATVVVQILKNSNLDQGQWTGRIILVGCKTNEVAKEVTMRVAKQVKGTVIGCGTTRNLMAHKVEDKYVLRYIAQQEDVGYVKEYVEAYKIVKPLDKVISQMKQAIKAAENGKAIGIQEHIAYSAGNQLKQIAKPIKNLYAVKYIYTICLEAEKFCSYMNTVYDIQKEVEGLKSSPNYEKQSYTKAKGSFNYIVEEGVLKKIIVPLEEIEDCHINIQKCIGALQNLASINVDVNNPNHIQQFGYELKNEVLEKKV